MHCRSCGYALWNLSEPRCPECGTGFDLRTYRFRPGTVEFACPRCDARYGGSGDLFIPTEADQICCGQCGAEVPTAAMRVVPTVDDLALAEAGPADLIPWEDRRRLGGWRAWFHTLGWSLAKPTKLGEHLGPHSRWTDAYWFALRTMLTGMATQFAILGAVAFAVVAVASEGDVEAMLITLAIVAGVEVFAVLYALLFPLLMAAFMAGPAHLYLRYSGPLRGGFGLTVAGTLYAQGPHVFWAIPVCGYYFNSAWQIWSLVSAILITMKAQGVAGWRATIAFLWLPVALMALALAFALVMMIVERSASGIGG